jgi:excisionase family DNA binding protein
LAVARRALSTGEAAALASCHPTTIRRAILAGQLEAIRLGRTGDFRIAPEALTKWMRPIRTDPKERP